ncbi:MAG: hypothetical protein E6H47_05575 [Betaproteobacteria bacterium]|nr:MAG: hypothetical protein E6H47_05575 [Betaproteobacteria bacterium]
MILSLVNSAYMYHLPKKNSIQIGQRALQGSVVDRAERLAELPADLVDFLRSRGLALAAQWRDGGPQAAPVRGIVYTPDQLVGLEAIDELGDIGSHARASRGASISA